MAVRAEPTDDQARLHPFQQLLHFTASVPEILEELLELFIVAAANALTPCTFRPRPCYP
jgi:hypothetical protein